MPSEKYFLLFKSSHCFSFLWLEITNWYDFLLNTNFILNFIICNIPELFLSKFIFTKKCVTKEIAKVKFAIIWNYKLCLCLKFCLEYQECRIKHPQRKHFKTITELNLTTRDSYFTILVEVFTNHISTKSTHFTNHIERTEHSIMVLKLSNKYQIIWQCHNFKNIFVDDHSYFEYKFCKHHF